MRLATLPAGADLRQGPRQVAASARGVGGPRERCCDPCPRKHTNMHAYKYTYKHTSMQTYKYTNTRARMHACTHARMHTCTHARMHACIHACMHTYIHACIHAYIHARMHACMQAGINVELHQSEHINHNITCLIIWCCVILAYVTLQQTT